MCTILEKISVNRGPSGRRLGGGRRRLSPTPTHSKILSIIEICAPVSPRNYRIIFKNQNKNQKKILKNLENPKKNKKSSKKLEYSKKIRENLKTRK